jgi:hypothetical protein
MKITGPVNGTEQADIEARKNVKNGLFSGLCK